MLGCRGPPGNGSSTARSPSPRSPARSSLLAHGLGSTGDVTPPPRRGRLAARRLLVVSVARLATRAAGRIRPDHRGERRFDGARLPGRAAGRAPRSRCTCSRPAAIPSGRGRGRSPRSSRRVLRAHPGVRPGPRPGAGNPDRLRGARLGPGLVCRRADAASPPAGGRPRAARAPGRAGGDEDRRLAVAEERARIARDLHDSAAQAINVIAVQAGAARLWQEHDPGRSRAALETIEAVAHRTVAEIDQIVHTLRDDDASRRARRALPRPGRARLAPRS